MNKTTNAASTANTGAASAGAATLTAGGLSLPMAAHPVTQQYDIAGMVCASCAQTIEKAVSKLPGMNAASVNLATEKMSVSYDPAEVDETLIEKTVHDAGYEANAIVDERMQTAAKIERQKKLVASLWRRFWISAILSLALLYIGMLAPFGAPLPWWLAQRTAPVAFAFVQLALCVPTIALNWAIFRVGFSTLFKGHPNMDSLVAVGSGAAFLYSCFATALILAGRTGYAGRLYYESSAVILALITLGKYLETRAKGQASDAIVQLMDLAPKNRDRGARGRGKTRSGRRRHPRRRRDRAARRADSGRRAGDRGHVLRGRVAHHRRVDARGQESGRRRRGRLAQHDGRVPHDRH